MLTYGQVYVALIKHSNLLTPQIVAYALTMWHADGAARPEVDISVTAGQSDSSDPWTGRLIPKLASVGGYHTHLIIFQKVLLVDCTSML